MFRVLDVPDALSLRSVAPDAEITLRLEVEDGQVPENRGPWLMQMEGGLIDVEPYAGGAVDASLTIPVDTLSRIFIGALTPWQAVNGGLAEIDRPGLLKALDLALAVPKPWTFDRF
jgi:predicted acetyltransferase